MSKFANCVFHVTPLPILLLWLLSHEQENHASGAAFNVFFFFFEGRARFRCKIQIMLET